MRRRLDHVISLNQSRLDNVITQWTKINQIYIIGIYAAIERKKVKKNSRIARKFRFLTNIKSIRKYYHNVYKSRQ